MKGITTIAMSKSLKERLEAAANLRIDVNELWVWRIAVKLWDRHVKEQEFKFDNLSEDEQKTFNDLIEQSNTVKKFETGKSISGINQETKDKYDNNKLRFILNWYLEDIEEKVNLLPPIQFKEEDLKWVAYVDANYPRG